MKEGSLSRNDQDCSKWIYTPGYILLASGVYRRSLSPKVTLELIFKCQEQASVEIHFLPFFHFNSLSYLCNFNSISDLRYRNVVFWTGSDWILPLKTHFTWIWGGGEVWIVPHLLHNSLWFVPGNAGHITSQIYFWLCTCIHINGCSSPVNNRNIPGSHSVTRILENELYAEVTISHAHPSSINISPNSTSPCQNLTAISTPPYSRTGVIKI